MDDDDNDAAPSSFASLADELDRKANVETIHGVAESSRRRFPGLKGDRLYKEVVRQLRHWRPDIPQGQIDMVLLGRSPEPAGGRPPRPRPPTRP